MVGLKGALLLSTFRRIDLPPFIGLGLSRESNGDCYKIDRGDYRTSGCGGHTYRSNQRDPWPVV